MTADFKIGNAEIAELEDSDDGIEYIEYYLYIPTIELPDAPTFRGDSLTHNSNFRIMSYDTSGKFFKTHKLGKFCNMFHGNYATVKITPEMVAMFTESRERHQAGIGEKVPGWSDLPMIQVLPDGNHHITTNAEHDAIMIRDNLDPDLARLMWFEWWLKWSLENCERPAIQWS